MGLKLMVHKMSIRTRLILAFSVLLALLLAVAAVSLQRLEALTATTQDIVNFQARRAQLAQRINQHAQAEAILLLNLLQTTERDERVKLYAALDREIAASGKAVSDLDMTMLSPQMQNEINQVSDLRQRYSVLLQETVELIEVEGTASARNYFENRTHKVLNTLLFDTQALEQHLQQMMQSELEQLKLAADQARQRVIWLAIVALVIGALLAWFIARGIVIPVRSAVALARDIAAGRYDLDVPQGQRGEIGALLRALRTMRDSIASREEKILKLAYVDPLTNLPNRTRFNELFEARQATDIGALVLLDINRFAPINNALGHNVGDRLLCAVATRILGVVGTDNTVARLWADQYALLLPGVDQSTATALMKRVIDAVRAPMLIEGQLLDIEVSTGVALYPQDGVDSTTLLRRAGLALTAAKRRHAVLEFAAHWPDEPSPSQLSLIGEMREALKRGEFVIYYQPKLHLATNKITATEALIRWRHPVKGMVPPMQFIPFAEQTGFIRDITPWVLRQVIADAAQWTQRGLAVVASANLSTLDLMCQGLVQDVAQMLAESGLPPAQLCLEITESALMDQPDLALQHLHELSKLGLKLSIDDYGTGQSSLAYVKTLPVNELKIDRAFVTAVDVTPKNAAIVRSTLLLCQELGLSVVAEGAETAEELAWLVNNHCDLVQGYVVARPMPLPEFLAWVEKFNVSSAIH
ncbi:MAG: EAL domain-containing protein [Rhodoferax sp.]|nr:EAL domain-containing protein [Rhodoferax sp.]